VNGLKAKLAFRLLVQIVFNRFDIIIVSSGSIDYVVDYARGFYFGTVRLGIEFTDENGTVRYMRTEPNFWINSVDLILGRNS